jgi:hypothetical protein
MPFYILLATFRVLSMTIVISTFKYYSIVFYALAILLIIIIGYLKTSKGKDFLTRGLRSAVTTGKTFKLISWETISIIVH